MKFLFSMEKSIGSIIFRRKENGEKEFLIFHYPDNHWDLAKGKMRGGETENFALLREIAEKTGITEIDVIPKFKKEIRYFYRATGEEALQKISNNESLNVIKKVVYYLAEVRNKKIVLSAEYSGYGWFLYDAAFSRIAYSGGRKVFLGAKNFIEKYDI